MVKYNKLEDAISNVMGIMTSPNKESDLFERVKAGTWQADDNFSDLYMRVMFNHFFQVNVPKTIDVLAHETKCDVPWAEQHFQERVEGSPTNPGTTYKFWPYKTFSEEDDFMDGKVFSHTYQERFWPKQANFSENEVNHNKGIRYGVGDLEDVMRQLKSNPLTRQAYLPIFFPEDTGAVHGERVPCTLGYYFLDPRWKTTLQLYD